MKSDAPWEYIWLFLAIICATRFFDFSKEKAPLLMSIVWLAMASFFLFAHWLTNKGSFIPIGLDQYLQEKVSFLYEAPEPVQVHILDASAANKIAKMTNKKLNTSAAASIDKGDNKMLLVLLNEMKNRRLTLPDSYYYIYAKALSERGLHAEAKTYASYYLKRTQNKGSYANAAKNICHSSC